MTATHPRHTAAQQLVRRISILGAPLRSRPRPGLRVLLYHAIGSAVPHDTYGQSVEPADFAEQMRWLREDSGHAIVSLAAGASALRVAGDTAVAVTFDDGFLDVLTVAAPVLAHYRIPFTVFVVNRFVEQSPAPGLYLDLESLKELAMVPGASIGSHGLTHRPLSRLSPTALVDELRQSGDQLAAAVGRRPVEISYPYGLVNDSVCRGAEVAGFKFGATSLIGVNRARTHPLKLRRTEIVSGDRIADVAGKIRGDYDWYQVKQRLYWPLPPDP